MSPRQDSYLSDADIYSKMMETSNKFDYTRSIMSQTSSKRGDLKSKFQNKLNSTYMTNFRRNVAGTQLSTIKNDRDRKNLKTSVFEKRANSISKQENVSISLKDNPLDIKISVKADYSSTVETPYLADSSSILQK